MWRRRPSPGSSSGAGSTRAEPFVRDGFSLWLATLPRPHVDQRHPAHGPCRHESVVAASRRATGILGRGASGEIRGHIRDNRRRQTWLRSNRVAVRYGSGGAYLSARGKHVWLEVGSGGGPNERWSAAQLFASRDGGMTWRLVSAHARSGSGTLPGFGWLVFTSAQDGFASAGLGNGAGLTGL